MSQKHNPTAAAGSSGMSQGGQSLTTQANAGFPQAGAGNARPPRSQQSPQHSQQSPLHSQQYTQFSQPNYQYSQPNPQFYQQNKQAEANVSSVFGQDRVDYLKHLGYQDFTQLDNLLGYYFANHPNLQSGFSGLMPEQVESLTGKPLPEIDPSLGEQFDNYLDPNVGVTPNSDQALRSLEEDTLAAMMQMEAEAIEEALKEASDEVSKYIQLVNEIGEKVGDMGLDFGIWFDDSLGNLNQRTINQLQEYLNLLKNNEQIKQIIDLIGKMSQQAAKEEIVKVTYTTTEHQWNPDFKEEIVGLTISKDLTWALASELATLGDAETEMLFDIKYLNESILNFELHAHDKKTIEHEKEETKSTLETRGPVIMAIDTSGSMAGMPEAVGKAVALFTSTKCRQENRDCYIINFSTSITTIDLSGKGGFDKLMRFLSMSFNGGTSGEEFMQETLRLMARPNYAKADLLVVSDMIMPRLPYWLTSRMEEQRQRGSTFNCLVVEDVYDNQARIDLRKEALDDYDRAWYYATLSNTVTEILDKTDSPSLFNLAGSKPKR